MNYFVGLEKMGKDVYVKPFGMYKGKKHVLSLEN